MTLEEIKAKMLSYDRLRVKLNKSEQNYNTLRSIELQMPEIIKELLGRCNAIEDCLKVQKSNGNWNYDAYMHGMANGMILCMSLLKGNAEPEYLDAPDQWLCDRPNTVKPEVCLG